MLLLPASVQLSWLKALADRHYESCCTHSDNISWRGREASATLMKNQRFRMKCHNRNYANTSYSAAQATKATNESKTQRGQVEAAFSVITVKLNRAFLPHYQRRF